MAEKDVIKIWENVATILESLQAKIKEANEKCFTMQKQLKETLEENSRLQATINVLKKKSCTKCAKLIDCIELLKKKLKEKDDTISVIGKLFLNHNPESYAAASQMVNEIITSSSTADNTIFDKSPTCTDLDVSVQPATPPPKSPDRTTNPERTIKESLIVAKKCGSGKRKFLSISSLRRNKQLNGNRVPCVPDAKKLDDNDLNETNLLNATQNAKETTEPCDNIMECTPPLNSLASPEILSSMSNCNCLLKGEKEIAFEETPKHSFQISRRSLDMNSVDADRKHSSPEAKRRTPETFYPSKGSKHFELMDLEIAKDIEPLPEAPLPNGHNESKTKTMWNLKRNREQLTNNKLKAIALEKKADISTSSQYEGGSAVLLNVKKSDITPCKFTSRENFDETFFEPLLMSTRNESQIPAPQNAAKAAALDESTNKPRSSRKIDDSFCCLPSTSPKYKYQRDAIRKKSERMKLPGQECERCTEFYEAKRAELGDTQVRKLLNKCSRHRYKFPIKSYTPPGLWNPVFDDTDDEVDVK